MLLLSHRYLKGPISANQGENFNPIFKIDLIIDIFLQRKYFQDKKYLFPFKLKIAISRPKMNILSSGFLQTSYF